MNSEKPEIIIYQTPDGLAKIDVRLKNGSLWLSQAQIAELSGRYRSVITKHLSNIYAEGELDKDSTCAKFAQVQIEKGCIDSLRDMQKRLKTGGGWV